MNKTIIEKLIIPSDLNSISQVESLIDRVCGSIGVNEDAYGNILIAITEAVNNAVIHGNHFEESKGVLIEVSQTDENLMFSVADEGNGFDYTNLPDPTAPENLEKENGRGIFLIRNLADNIEFDKNGSVINIYFNRA